jgi:hypothetical protein
MPSNKGPEETTTEQFARRLVLAAEINQKLAALKAAGTSHESEEVQDLIAKHHSWAIEFIPKDRTTYIKLANKYRNDDRFDGLYNQYAEGLARYMGDAIEVYANSKLTDDQE